MFTALFHIRGRSAAIAVSWNNNNNFTFLQCHCKIWCICNAYILVVRYETFTRFIVMNRSELLSHFFNLPKSLTFLQCQSCNSCHSFNITDISWMSKTDLQHVGHFFDVMDRFATFLTFLWCHTQICNITDICWISWTNLQHFWHFFLYHGQIWNVVPSVSWADLKYLHFFKVVALQCAYIMWQTLNLYFLGKTDNQKKQYWTYLQFTTDDKNFNPGISSLYKSLPKFEHGVIINLCVRDTGSRH